MLGQLLIPEDAFTLRIATKLIVTNAGKLRQLTVCSWSAGKFQFKLREATSSDVLLDTVIPVQSSACLQLLIIQYLLANCFISLKLWW